MNLALAWLLLAVPLAPARSDDPDEIPLVGRPVDLPFSEASAGFAVTEPGPKYRVPFEVRTGATPVEVEELAPVTFTVVVRSVGRLRRPPARLDLRQVPAFDRRFHIEDVTDGKLTPGEPGEWTWVYRLKPRSVSVTEVPGFPFVFYNPDLRPADKAFQVIWTDTTRLRVRDRDRAAPPMEVPLSVLELDLGPGVLAVETPWPGPGKTLIVLVVAGPPAACLLWYLLWRRLHPDAARLASRRRSRAERRALSALGAATRLQARDRAEAVARALAGYLRERFDLASAEPTGEEVANHLSVWGVTEELRGQGQVLMMRCATGRFAPGGEEGDLVGEARAWILAVEEASCPRSS